MGVKSAEDNRDEECYEFKQNMMGGGVRNAGATPFIRFAGRS
jgi:hypothetical protein